MIGPTLVQATMVPAPHRAAYDYGKSLIVIFKDGEAGLGIYGEGINVVPGETYKHPVIPINQSSQLGSNSEEQTHVQFTPIS